MVLNLVYLNCIFKLDLYVMFIMRCYMFIISFFFQIAFTIFVKIINLLLPMFAAYLTFQNIPNSKNI